MAAVEPTGISALGIDTKLIVAQAINFVIVLLLLRLLAYKPIIRVLLERRKRIEQSVRNTEAIERSKQELERKTNKVLEEATSRATTIVSQAKTEAAEFKRRVQDDLRAEREKMVAGAKQEITSQLQTALNQARKDLGYLAIKLSEKILRAKLDPRKDSKLVRQALKELP